MSKNGFGKQGNAILRRRWLARAEKRKDEKNAGQKENRNCGTGKKQMGERGGSLQAKRT